MPAPQPQGRQALPTPLPRGSVQKRWHLSTLQGQGTGEEGPTQHLAIVSSFRESWEISRRVAAPPFPACGMSGCFAPSQPLSGTGGCATCREPGGCVGGVTEDPRPSWNTVANIPYPGHPRHGVRKGLEPRARKGRWRAAPGPKGQQNGTGEPSPGKGALSPPDPPPSPTLGHLSGHRPPPPKTAIFGHAHRHHSGLLMSQDTSLPSVPGPINTGTPAPGPQFAELRGVLSCQRWLVTRGRTAARRVAVHL